MKKTLLISMSLLTILASSAFAKVQHKPGTPNAAVAKFMNAVRDGNMGDIYETSTENNLNNYSDIMKKGCWSKASVSVGNDGYNLSRCLKYYDFVKVSKKSRKLNDKSTLVFGTYKVQYNPKNSLGFKFRLIKENNGWKINKVSR